jgi:ferritin-like metal-binding protein YciE
MDASPDSLAENVRAKRVAVDKDLGRLQKADSRRLDVRRWARTALPIAAGTVAIWTWARRARAVRSLEDLLAYGLNELDATERQLLPKLRRMAGHATSPELRKALETHCSETEGHIERLARARRAVGVKRKTRGVSTAVAGIIIAGSERLLRRNADPDMRDAWLVATARQIEHIEIATYGTVKTYAETLGFADVAQLLHQTLEEELATDAKLTRLAERFINPQSIRSAPV